MTHSADRPPHQILRIATRQSALAMWQAEHIQQQLQTLHPQLTVELLPMVSRGDKILDVPLAKIGGKGLFVKELEHALLDQKADIAVHSMKDVPMAFPDGLGLSVICPREDPRDAFVSNQYRHFTELPSSAVIGTSSLRRQCQLLAKRPDLKVTFLRGNVNTRLAKLDAGDYDAIILASAGLLRLGMPERITEYLAPELCLPAGGQGVIGIECRTSDTATQALLKPLQCQLTSECVTAERALNQRLDGGCQVPIACYAIHNDRGQLWLRGFVGSPDGRQRIAKDVTGDPSDAANLGVKLADELLEAGAGTILKALYAND